MKPKKPRIIILGERSEQMAHMVDALVSAGHIITIVTTAEEVLTQLSKRAADLIVIDLGTPASGNYEFATTLKRIHPALPVLIITGETPEPAAFQVAEINGRISKPFRIGHIEALIQNLLKMKFPEADKPANDIILVVDDDDTFRELLIRTLKLSGYAAVGATDGQTALEILEKGGIRAVFADIIMPRMNGITLLQHVKNRWPAIPVVLITGYFSPDEGLGDTDVSPDGFLLKPFQIQSVIDLLQSLKLDRLDVT